MTAGQPGEGGMMMPYTTEDDAQAWSDAGEEWNNLTAERDAARAEAADLRRQVEHANRWRDNAILEANEARAELADLRRQLAECQAQAEEAQRESYRRGADADRAVAIRLLNVVRAILGTPDEMDIRHHARQLVAEHQATVDELHMLRERCTAVPWDALYDILYYPAPQDDAMHDARHWYAGACPLGKEMQP